MTDIITKQMFADWKQNEVTLYIKQQIIDAINYYRELLESEDIHKNSNEEVWQKIGNLQSIKRVLYAFEDSEPFSDEENKEEEK